jgi:hypothetical protein
MPINVLYFMVFQNRETGIRRRGVGMGGMVTPLLYADFIDFEEGVTIPLKIRLTSRVKGGQA